MCVLLKNEKLFLFAVFFFAGAEPSPALLVASTKKRARKSSKDVPESKDTSPKTADDSAPKNKGRGRKPKPKPGNLSHLL